MFRLVISVVVMSMMGWAQAQKPARRPAQKPASTTKPAADTSGITSKRVVPAAEQQTFQAEASERIAIVVAVGNYPESDGLPALRFPLADALELSGELKRQGYNVFELLNNEATADNVRGKLRTLPQLIDKGQGTVIFFFTGHGFQSDNKNYLATYGTNVNNLTALGLPFDEVKELLAASGARRRVMLVDACRNDPGAKASVRSFQTLSQSEGLRAILSTRPGGFSYEDSSLQHGIFTSFLLKGLRGAAVGPDGLITFDDISNYVTTSVFKYASERSLIQKPFQLSDGSGDFLIASAGKASEAQIAESTPATPPSSNTLILSNLDDRSRYYVDLNDETLRLFRLPGKDAYAVLNRKPSKDTSVLFFSGPASGNGRLDAVVRKTGAVVTQVDGRFGTPRNPNDMSPPQWVPLLDEEKSSTKGQVVKSKPIADSANNVLRTWFPGRGAKAQQTVANSTRTATAVQAASLPADQKDFNWKRFELTTEYQGK